jgi:hypothetical protein
LVHPLSAGGAEERRAVKVEGEKQIGEMGRGEWAGDVLGLLEDVITERDGGRGGEEYCGEE